MIRIERLELHLVRLPLRREFRTSSHAKSHLDHILIRATASDGCVGWGECASPSDPYFCAENVGTCWLMLRDYLGPAVIGREWETPEQAASLTRRIQGNRFARAGLDLACWDVWTRRESVSLASALGGTQSHVAAGVSLGIEPTVGELVEQVGAFQQQGYRRVKLKIAPGWDVEPVRAVRAEFGDLPLHVDANGAYQPGPDSDAVFAGLDGFGLLMVEQPYPAAELLAHARLQQRLRTPVCLDESIASPADAETALALGAARVVNVKVSRLGGIGPARDVHDLCRDRGVPVWCGGMHEFGVGRAANVAVASLPGFTLPSDISGSDKYFATDVVEPPVAAAGGLVPVPYHRVGTGHEVAGDRVAERTIARLTLDADGPHRQEGTPCGF